VPVARSLTRGDELEDVVVEVGRPQRFMSVGREDVLGVAIRARGERLTLPQLWPVDNEPWDAEWFASEVYDLLQDEIVESRFAWGELRTGEYEVPPPLTS
jgi:hypothetical protein